MVLENWVTQSMKDWENHVCPELKGLEKICLQIVISMLAITITTKFFAGRSGKINQNSKSCHLSFLSFATFVILAVFPTFLDEL